MLKLKTFDEMLDWARNLANHFPFLSDGSIIWAWPLIHQQPSNEAEIRTYLTKAATIGRRSMPPACCCSPTACV